MKQVKVNAMSYALMIKALQDGPHTCADLAALTGLSPRTIKSYVQALHAAGTCHVTAWAEDSTGRASLRAYRLGAGRDVRRPRKSDRVRQQEYAERAKQRAPVPTLAQVWG